MISLSSVSVLLIVGSAIIIALGAGKAINHFRMPMVVGYVFIGVFLGKSFLNVLAPDTVEKMGVINDLALGIIAFIIGGELNFGRLKSLGKIILIIAIFESLGAFLLVAGGIYLVTHKIYMALILGAIASATAPAATVAVINQYRTRGPLTTSILGVVGSDDAIALIIYAFASAISYPFLTTHSSVSWLKIIINPIQQIFLAFAVGGILGTILSYLLKKLSLREERFALVMGFILIAEGFAHQIHCSELLLVMSMSIVGSNIASHHFNSVMDYVNIAGFPLIAAFFCLAGTRLDIKLLPQIGLLGIIYLIARGSGKYLGANIGASIAGAPIVIRKYIGLSLWPQIGVAVALAIVVERDFGHLGAVGHHLAVLAMNILLFTTIFTEIIGPLATKFALGKAGEINKTKEK